MKNLNLKFNRQKTIALLKKLVEINSGSENKAGVDRVGEILSSEFKKLGFRIKKRKHQKMGDLIIAETPSKNGLPKILLSEHLDTVFPSNSNFQKFSLKKDKAFGPGTSDMKGSLLVILLGASVLKKDLGKLFNLTITLIPDEEKGSQAHKNFLYKLYPKFDIGLVFESVSVKKSDPRGEKSRILVTARKGGSLFEIQTFGESAHSGISEKKRISAVEELAQKIILLQKLTNPKTRTTVNVGKISGGVAPNVIAPFAQAEFDLRVVSKKQEKKALKKIEEIVKKTFVKGTKTKLKKKFSFPPMEKTKKTAELLRIFKKVGDEMEIEVGEEFRAGSSDGNQIAQLGVTVIDGLGAVGGKSHSPKEFLYIESIFTSAEFLYRVLKKLLEKRRAGE